MCLVIKKNYLCAPMSRFEYIKMPINIFLQHVKEEYNQLEKVHKGCGWIEIRRRIYGLPQSGRLANNYLRNKIAPHGYFEVKHTPGLWTHITRPIQFTLAVDDFGVKYTRRKDAEHLLSVLEKEFTAVSTDWEGALYCGITLEWNYEVKMARHIHARLYSKSTAKVQALITPKTTTLTICHRPK